MLKKPAYVVGRLVDKHTMIAHQMRNCGGNGWLIAVTHTVKQSAGYVDPAWIITAASQQHNDEVR